jgi:hypothetical protein
MILDFADATQDELGEILWTAWVTVRIVRDEGLRDMRPAWNRLDDATRAFWDAYADRLRALYDGVGVPE